jgi:hypothetical protein
LGAFDAAFVPLQHFAAEFKEGVPCGVVGISPFSMVLVTIHAWHFSQICAAVSGFIGGGLAAYAHALVLAALGYLGTGNHGFGISQQWFVVLGQHGVGACQDFRCFLPTMALLAAVFAAQTARP